MAIALTDMKEKIIRFLKESGQSKTQGISMMLNVSLKSPQMKRALAELVDERRVKKDGLMRYTWIRPVATDQTTANDDAGVSATREISEPAELPVPSKSTPKATPKPVKKTAESTPEPTTDIDKSITKVSTDNDKPSNSKTAAKADVPAPVATEKPIAAHAAPRTLDDVISRMESRLTAGPVENYENKVTVLTRLSLVSEPEISVLLEEIAEDLRSVENRALRRA